MTGPKPEHQHDDNTARGASEDDRTAQDRQTQNERLGELLSGLGDELRTPLNAILGLAGLLLESSSLPPLEHECAASIRSSGTALLSLVDSLIDFSTLQTGELALDNRAFDVRECVADVMTTFAPDADAKQLSFESEIDAGTPLLVVGDILRIKQILRNLLSASIRHTYHGAVRLHVSVTGDAPSRMLQFEVRDTGSSVPDLQVDGIPRAPATDGERAQHRRAGAGLGLAITRHLLTLMGGSLTIASDPGAGSTFMAVIPFKEPQPARKERHRRSASKGRRAHAEHGIAGLRILLAEDNAMNQRVALNLLGRFGCTAEIAHNGVEALAALSRSEYDVVLMDVQMPEMDGLEATREIVRRYAPAARPFIIAMTANTLASDRTACADAGMDDFVSKPVDVQQFRDALQRGLEHVKHRNDKKSGASADGARDLVDRSVLAQYATSDDDSSHETLRRVVGMYLMDIPIKLQALNAAMDANDVKSVGYYAHNIQGSFSMLGAMQLAAHCRQLVEECTQNAHARAVSTITRIEREFASVRTVLHDMGLTV